MSAAATVSGAAYATAGNVALIVELERVENRMEAACSTLKEATELSVHFAQVEAVFAKLDLQRIAATLDSIRQGLALVGDVPEFKGGAARLGALEGRFNQNIDLASLYVAAGMPMLQAGMRIWTQRTESHQVGNSRVTEDAIRASQKRNR
ncbi:hypothetical protein WJX75_009345 [Coccomyxa subellipsoidea]|uniref:Conserved oligomeric Golgi complex subunit 7 n=1 Tax=Coccomyxa subellipsoidea TaxID=248742 RepID=A0ABR2Z231_9CHLO